jgi:hypothetical protein
MNISPAPTIQTDDVSISFFSGFEVTGSPEFLKNFSPDLWALKNSSPSSCTEKNRAKRARKKSKK